MKMTATQKADFDAILAKFVLGEIAASEMYQQVFQVLVYLPTKWGQPMQKELMESFREYEEAIRPITQHWLTKTFSQIDVCTCTMEQVEACATCQRLAGR